MAVHYVDNKRFLEEMIEYQKTRDIANRHLEESNSSINRLGDSSIQETLLKLNSYLVDRTY